MDKQNWMLQVKFAGTARYWCEQTFASVAKFASITLPIAIAALYKFRLVQLDFITAFLNSDAEKEI
jgi:hypothetical protein